MAMIRGVMYDKSKLYPPSTRRFFFLDTIPRNQLVEDFNTPMERTVEPLFDLGTVRKGWLLCGRCLMSEFNFFLPMDTKGEGVSVNSSSVAWSKWSNCSSVGDLSCIGLLYCGEGFSWTTGTFLLLIHPMFYGVWGLSFYENGI